jgi:uncharacterized membrane protein YkvI
MTMALPLSMQSFSSLVSKIYPVFGLLGVSIIGSLFYRAVKELGGELYYKLIQFFSKGKEG